MGLNHRPPGYEPDELPLLYPTICSRYRIRTCASGLLDQRDYHLHQTDFTKYRPYLLLTLHGFLVRYFPTPPTGIVQMLSEFT